MSLSLRDQLLQAGLIDPKKARQAARSQHRERVEQGKRPSAVPDPREEAARKAAAEKAARDAELDRQRQEKLRQQARRAEVRQLIGQHRVARVDDSDTLYNFVDGKKVRRIPVSPAQRDQLVAGTLAVVRGQGRYELVPAAIGQRIADRDARSLVWLSPPDATPAADDPYKDYVVPDDLTW